jgi:Domain of unknown function (DUF4157)
MGKEFSTAATSDRSVRMPAGGLLQRRCACGNHTIDGGECAECGKGKNNLQRKFGNQNVSGNRLFRSRNLILQSKLALGANNDPLEHEADRVADQVLAASSYSTVGGSFPQIQRSSGTSAGQVGAAPGSVDRVLTGSGNPLSITLRRDMEHRFGYDFSQVRVHAGPAAEASARDVNAQAYTVGHNIVFGSGRFQPSTSAGRRLIAHELTHVIQQTGTTQGRVDRRDEDSLSPVNALKRVAQRASLDQQLLRRKCDIDPALDYYRKTAPGKKVNYAEWLEKMRKVAGPANKSLYEDAKAAKQIDRSFVVLVCKVQKLLNIGEDGQIGTLTADALEKFSTGGAKGIDYTRLFKDKKLEVGIAIGESFDTEFTAIVGYLETEGKKLKNFSSSGTAGSKVIKFTKDFPVQGDKTAPPVAIDVVFNIISATSATPKKTYTEFLSQQELVIYSGHARYGTGPDFDEKKSVKENFIIGVNSALHKAGKLTPGYNAHMNKILEGYGNDLEAMSKAGKFDPDKYQVWFFNACSSINYLDEVRKGLVTAKSGKIKSKANLRFVGTRYSVSSDAMKIVDSILKMKTMDEIISIMDINEKALPREPGEKEHSSYYFSD